MVARVVLVVALLLGVHVAHAQPIDDGVATRSLAKARDAIAAVHYDEAQALLVKALQAGDASPYEVAEIYKLSASTAIVLGQTDVAERYYRRWIALVPTASLPDSVAPKLRQPFVAAQAYMAAHGRLTMTAERRGDNLDVVIQSDPLGMVVGIAFDDEKVPLGGDHGAHKHLAAESPSPEVAAIDEFGNHLAEIIDPPRVDSNVVAAPPRTPPPQPASSIASTSSTSLASPSLPLYRKPLAWVVVGSAFAATGIGFGLAARSAQSDVDAIAADPSSHFASDFTDAQHRRDRDALIANLAFAGAGACAITAAIVWLTLPSANVTVAPTAGGATASMSLAF